MDHVLLEQSNYVKAKLKNSRLRYETTSQEFYRLVTYFALLWYGFRPPTHHVLSVLVSRFSAAFVNKYKYVNYDAVLEGAISTHHRHSFSPLLHRYFLVLEYFLL